MTNDCCPLCTSVNEHLIVKAPKFRIILVDDKDYPAYFRVIWSEHKKEMSDLTPTDQMILWNVLSRLEKIMIDEIQPDKINLAEFGNMVPHLHWHLIARWADDAAFPDNPWMSAKRTVSQQVLEFRRALAQKCAQVIKEKFSDLSQQN
ncbi:MAG: HIT family protein [Burkholderiaceae bacterium]|nr:HIT family protein [Burkholderiaceae bacterium]